MRGSRILGWLLRGAALTSLGGCSSILCIDNDYVVDCQVDADCKGVKCINFMCDLPRCSDGIRNGVETDRDCGGNSTCHACQDGKMCLASSDCEGGVCGANSFCCTPPCPTWVQRFGDEPNQVSHGVTLDAQGNVFITGTFEGTLDFGAVAVKSATSGTNDVFLAKLDPQGGGLWAQRFSGAHYQASTDVAVDASGNVFVTGEFDTTFDIGTHLTSPNGAGLNDVFLSKFNASGKNLWSKSFLGPESDYVRGVAVDPDGNVLLTGFTGGGLDFGCGALANQGDEDLYIAKLDANGKCMWSYSFGDAASQQGYDIAADADGNVLVTGRFSGKLDFGGGAEPLSAAKDLDVFVVKLDPKGSALWSFRLGGDLDQDGRGIAVGKGGEVFVTGRYYGTSTLGESGMTLPAGGDLDVFVIELSPAGKLLWSQHFGTPGSDEGDAVAVDSSGHVLVTGFVSQGTIDLGGDTFINVVDVSDDTSNVFLAELDSTSGEFLRASVFRTGNHRSQTTNPDIVNPNLATASERGSVLSAAVRGPADFGTWHLAAQFPGVDVVVARFPP